MKKILALVTCLVLICSFSVTAFAQGATATLNGVPSEIKKDATATVTANVSGSPTLSSALVQITLGDGLELVSGEWKKDGIMKDFTVSNGYGVIALSSAGTIDGTVFSFVVKGKTISANAQNIKVDFTFKNGSENVGMASVSKTVKVACATHSYGNYTNAKTTNHTRTCSACGNVETKAQTWNSGTVTKPASCKETGIKTYTCTACNATKTETVSKTENHTWGSWNTAKQPNCTTVGTKTRTCSACGKTENQTISATGHSMGAWSQSKAPTCTANGEEKRSCSKCGYSETKAISALGHSFSNPTVTKQPTCTEAGVETGKCTRCGQTTSNSIKAKGHKFGNWADTKTATCTEGGVQERKCTECGIAESRNTEPLGHDFENPTILKEPTISVAGLKEGKCKRCGEATQEVIPCTAKDEATGIVIEADEGVFVEGAQLVVEEIKGEADTRLETAQNALKEISDRFVAYDLSVVLNGGKVNPNGKVKVTFNIPEGFSSNVKLFYIDDNGAAEEQDAQVNDDGTVTAELSHFSTYALCDMESTETTDITTDKADTSKQNGNTMLWVIIAVAAVVVIAGVIVTVVVIMRKKAK